MSLLYLLVLFAGASPPAGSSAQGMRGLERVEAAEARRPGELTLQLSASMFRAHDFLIPGDSHSGSSQLVLAAFSPLEHLDVSASWARVAQENSAFLHPVGHAGDPRFAAKYSVQLEPVALAGGLSLFFPTAWQAPGVALGAPAATFYGALSVPVSRALISFNLGYRLDRTAEAAPFGINGLQRFGAGLVPGSGVIGGAGGEFSIATGESLELSPFAELTGQAAGGAAFGDNPLLLTVGARVLLFARVEARLHGDLRLAGAPRPESKVLGAPPWSAGLSLATHFGLYPPPPMLAEPAPAPPPPPTPAPAPAPEPVAGTFEIQGAIASTEGGPISGAVIKLAGYPAALATDAQGAFHSWPIPTGEGLLRLEVQATGYKPGEAMVARGEAGKVVEVAVQLTPMGQDVPGMVRGNIKDGRTGKPIQASINLPTRGKLQVTVTKQGGFEAKLPPGHYPIVISHPGYQTQTKEISISPGETVILNVDLRHK